MLIFPDTKLSHEHPRWIGAWWLGFVILGGVQLVSALPLFWFPKQIKSESIDVEPAANGKAILPLTEELESPVKHTEAENGKDLNQKKSRCCGNSSKYTLFFNFVKHCCFFIRYK